MEPIEPYRSCCEVVGFTSRGRVGAIMLIYRSWCQYLMHRLCGHILMLSSQVECIHGCILRIKSICLLVRFTFLYNLPP